MQGIAQRKKKPGRRVRRREHVVVRPQSSEDIVDAMSDARRFPSPVRPLGSNSATSRCNAAHRGTVLDMTALDRLVDLTKETVTVQAGMRLRDLAATLGEAGYELSGSAESSDRTVGGAVSSGCLAAGIPGMDESLAASVCSVSLITADGSRLAVGPKLPKLLPLVRMSYGLLGSLETVELRIRPIRAHAIRNRKFSFKELALFMPRLMRAKAGIKIHLLPFRDTAYVELRHLESGGRAARALPWKIRDWACNAVAPSVVRSVGKVVPIRGLRDPLVDSVNEATQMFMNTGAFEIGSNAAEQSGRFRALGRPQGVRSCTWLFPARGFRKVLIAYQRLCTHYYRASGYRCDLPAIAWRIEKDTSALLSPTHDRAAIAIQFRSTVKHGWEEYVLEMADFATLHSGIPLLNQSRGCTAMQVSDAYGERVAFFRNFRRRLDPNNRLVNQFLAEHIA